MQKICNRLVVTIFLASSTTTAFAQADATGGPGSATVVRPTPAQGTARSFVPATAPKAQERGTATGGNAGGKADKN